MAPVTTGQTILLRIAARPCVSPGDNVWRARLSVPSTTARVNESSYYEEVWLDQ